MADDNKQVNDDPTSAVAASAPDAASSGATETPTETSSTVSLEDIFMSCRFSPAVSYPGGAGRQGPKTAMRKIENKSTTNTSQTQWSTMAFFIDSSGRSSFSLPLQIVLSSQQHLDEFLVSGCIDPPPNASVVREEGLGQERQSANALLGFEVQNVHVLRGQQKSNTIGKKDDTDDHPIEVVVEGIAIQSSRVDDLVVSFDTTVTARINPPSSSKNKEIAPLLSNLSGTTTQFMVTPVLELSPSSSSHSENKEANKDKPTKPQTSSLLMPDFAALELAALPVSMNRQGGGGEGLSSSMSPALLGRSRTVRLPSVPLDVALTHAFDVKIKTIPSSTHPNAYAGGGSLDGGEFHQIGVDGTTMISLSVRHSNSHNYPVQITNIALHPGHSRSMTSSQPFVSGKTRNNDRPTALAQQHHDEVSMITNMTQSVQIRSADRTELDLPLTLHPWEEYSTVLCITASEEMQSRFFVCPLSVTGAVLFDNHDDGDKIVHGSEIGADGGAKNNDCHEQFGGCRVVVSSEAHWSTIRVAIEPEDAFRVELDTPAFVVERGKPIIVNVRIFNLNIESRNVMLLVAKERQVSTPNKISNSNEIRANTAVVSEADGYKFGVWGITEGDDGTAKLNRDSDLLSIDSALVLGDVQGQHAVDAELRFVPLRLGLLKIPDLRIYDQSAKRWYNCVHSLCVVSK